MGTYEYLKRQRDEAERLSKRASRMWETLFVMRRGLRPAEREKMDHRVAMVDFAITWNAGRAAAFDRALYDIGYKCVCGKEAQ